VLLQLVENVPAQQASPHPYAAGSPAASRDSSNGRRRFATDRAQIKYAALESEAVFFERLGKQDKIEMAQMLLNEARQKLQSARRDLGPPGLSQLAEAARELERSREALAVASRNIAGVKTELEAYHRADTPAAIAIASGRLDAAPLYSKIRRLIKTAERDLRQANLHLVTDQFSALNRVDMARRDLSRYVEALAEDDARRDKFRESIVEIEGFADALAAAGKEITALIDSLESIRRRHMPECSLEEGPTIETPAAPGYHAHDARRPATDRQRTSLMLLNRSLDAIAEIEMAAATLAAIDADMERLPAAGMAAIEHAEEADAVVNKVQHEARQQQIQAVARLDKAEEQLDEISRKLRGITVEADEVKPCAHCGKATVRSRKIPDPATLCAEAEAPMHEAQQSLLEARDLAEQMATALDAIKPPPQELDENRRRINTAIQRLRGSREGGDRGAIELLTLAAERGEEFRKQEFEFHPGEAYPPPEEPLPPRPHQPIFAWYVARETWHYPDYFEDLALERYGHSFGCVQPAVSYVKFLADLALLPYNAWLNPPCARQYDLGLYRPGDCAPRLIYLPEWDPHAALFEVAVWWALLSIP
jgi:predicted metal-dependent hydrolase